MNFDIENLRIGVIGLGYVGLPLAVEFGKQYDTVGFDIHAGRIAELESGTDSTLEATATDPSTTNDGGLPNSGARPSAGKPTPRRPCRRRG